MNAWPDIEVDTYETLTLGFQIESSNCYNEDTHIVKKLTNIWQILWKYLMKRNSWLWAPFEHELCGIKFCHTDFSIFLTLSWPFGVSKLLFAFRCAQDKSLLHSIICSKLLSWIVLFLRSLNFWRFFENVFFQFDSLLSLFFVSFLEFLIDFLTRVEIWIW